MLGHVVRNHGFARSALFALCRLMCAVPRSQADDGIVKDAASGCAVFKPNLRPSEVVVWKGSCQNGVAEGHGVARWNASVGATMTFEGKFAQGKLQGAGTMTASGGDRYDGNFKDGKRDGRGVYVSANRDRYEGEYKDNQRHGAGTLHLAFGNRAVGEWRNGTMVSSTSNLPRSAAPPIDPVLTQPTRPALTEGWQAQLAQQAVQEKAARELRAQQRED